MALDIAGNPHISYFDEDGDNLKYARWTGTRWKATFIDTAGSLGIYTSITLDIEGKPYISYYDITSKNLKAAIFKGISWNILTVDKYGDAGLFTSIAFIAEY